MFASSEKSAVTRLDAAEPVPRKTRNLRRILLRLSVKPLTHVLLLVLFCTFSIAPAMAGTDTGYWAPWVTKITTDSAIINWKGEKEGSGSVEYATSAYYKEHQAFQKKVESQTTGAYQHVPLADLEPNTSYIYRVKPSGDKAAFDNRTFRTMPVSGPFTFLVISDSHAQEKRFPYVAEAIAKYETDVLFILDGGDFAGHDDQTVWTDYFQYADKMLAKFPLVNTIGNHEYHQPSGSSDDKPTAADQYHWSFDIPTGGALNYSFDCSGVRFVILNSPDPNHANGDDPQPSLPLAKSQAPWLAEQLDNNLVGTFTIHHHPIWDYGRTGIDTRLRPWETLYHQYPISANFAGHTHCYQRYSVSGIPYFVVGNAGGKFDDLNPSDRRARWYRYGATRQLGYLKVAVDPEYNTATAQEIFVGSVPSDDSTDVTVYDPPIVADVVTFPLSLTLSTLTVTKSGLGTGTVISSDSSINCGSTCRAIYKKTAKVSFIPTADEGSVFMGWTGDCTGQGECSVTMRPNTDVTVGAIFEKSFCAYYLSPDKKIFTYKGGQVSVKVTAKGHGVTNCPAPTITNDTDWITYTSGPFANNKGTVVVTVPAYDNTAERKGILEIGGTDFTAVQKGR